VAAVLLLPGTALASPDTSASCDDPLVTYTRDGADGDQAAVALTAQSIERGVDGWDHVTWSAASGTALTGVYATDLNGTVTALAASATGTANEVVALTFCGSTRPVTLSATDPAEAVVEPEQDDPDEDAGTSDGTGVDEEGDVSIHVEFEPEVIIELEDEDESEDGGDGEQANGDGGDAGDAGDAGVADGGDAGVADGGDGDHVEVAHTDGDEGTGPSHPHSGNEATSEGGTDPSNPHSGNEATSGAGGTADPGADAEETEVLGVTIVAEADPTATADASENADTTADPIVAQAATSSTAGSTAPLLPVSVRILLALAALLGIAAAIRAGRSAEVSR